MEHFNNSQEPDCSGQDSDDRSFDEVEQQVDVFEKMKIFIEEKRTAIVTSAIVIFFIIVFVNIVFTT